MIDDQKEIKGGVSTKNVQGVLPAAGNMARRAHRVLMIAKREAENSEDQAYVNAVRESFNNLNSKVKLEILQKNETDQNYSNQLLKINFYKGMIYF